MKTLVIAAAHSGAGKTSVSIGLCRALRDRGLRVQACKVGPDFLDPSWLSLASGRPCLNLDGWMMGETHVRELVASCCGETDIMIIEGVMGAFDGAAPDSRSGSTAEIAAWLAAPLLLVVDAHGMAGSIAPLCAGFAGFDPQVQLAGVIANRVGSPGHGRLLAEALSAHHLPPLSGAIEREALPCLPERHLGLHAADQELEAESSIVALATAIAAALDLDTLLAQAGTHSQPYEAPLAQAPRCRIALAHDAAFAFRYPANLQALADQGAAFLPFSPIADRELPTAIDAIYLPGGYPELHAAELAANESMLATIRDFAESGGAIYAECGGLLYLGESIADREEVEHRMVGLIPIRAAMRSRLQRLGYSRIEPAGRGLWSQALRGHEFHYSDIVDDRSADAGWAPAWQRRRSRREGEPEAIGYRRGRIWASYVHAYWASNSQACAAFVDACCRETT